MAGSSASFPAADFRKAIRDAARMAAPNDALMVPRFHWNKVQTFQKADSGGRPYSFTSSETPATEDDIADLTVETVVAVVEKTIETPEGTRAGLFRGSRMTLTVLDVDYDAILAHGNGRFADSVLTGNTEYVIEEIPMPVALFQVDVWTVHAYAPTVAKPS
jgi:hypothetical protein